MRACNNSQRRSAFPRETNKQNSCTYFAHWQWSVSLYAEGSNVHEARHTSTREKRSKTAARPCLGDLLPQQTIHRTNFKRAAEESSRPLGQRRRCCTAMMSWQLAPPLLISLSLTTHKEREREREKKKKKNRHTVTHQDRRRTRSLAFAFFFFFLLYPFVAYRLAIKKKEKSLVATRITVQHNSVNRKKKKKHKNEV